jgi:hypothetical protein
MLTVFIDRTHTHKHTLTHRHIYFSDVNMHRYALFSYFFILFPPLFRGYFADIDMQRYVSGDGPTEIQCPGACLTHLCIHDLRAGERETGRGKGEVGAGDGRERGDRERVREGERESERKREREGEREREGGRDSKKNKGRGERE